MDQLKQFLDLKEFYSLLLRRRFVVLAVFLVTTFAVTAGSFMFPPGYTARSTIIIKFGREFIYKSEIGDQDSSRSFSLEEMVNSEVEILHSRDLARQVIEELGIEKIYPELAGEEESIGKATANFQQYFSVMAVIESSVIKLTFDHPDPGIAAESLNLLIEKFKDKHLEVFSDPKSDFLQTQTKKYQEQLAEAEAALEVFKIQQVFYQLPAQREHLLSQGAELAAELRKTRMEILILQQKLSTLKCQSSKASEVAGLNTVDQKASLLSQRDKLIMTLKDTEFKICELKQKLSLFHDRKGKSVAHLPLHPGLDNLRSIDEARIRLLDLQIKERELQKNFHPNSRELLAVKEEISLAREYLSDIGKYVESLAEMEIGDELAPLESRASMLAKDIQQLDSKITAIEVLEITLNLAPLEFKRDKLVEEIGKLENDLKAHISNEKKLRELDRNVVILERNLQTYLEKVEEARIAEDLDARKMVNLKVIESASPPISPSGLSSKMKIVLGMFVGLLAGVVAAFFLELIRG